MRWFYIDDGRDLPNCPECGAPGALGLNADGLDEAQAKYRDGAKAVCVECAEYCDECGLVRKGAKIPFGVEAPCDAEFACINPECWECES